MTREITRNLAFLLAVFLPGISQSGFSQEPRQPGTVLFSDSPAVSGLEQRKSSSSIEKDRVVEFDQKDPLLIVGEIAEEMRASQTEEATRLDAIRDGLRALQDRNQLLEKLTEQRNSEIEAVLERAARAQRIAEDARRTAEQSSSATVAAMQQLLSLRKKEQATAPAEVVLPPEPTTIGSNRDAQPTEPGPAADSPNSGAIPVERGLVDNSESSQPVPSTTPSLRSVPVFDQAIDREKFADNLFGAGEYKTSVAIYSDLIRLAPDGSDVAWYQYQAASCYRNLGKLDKAERLYRKVAAEKESFLASTARWWLSIIEDQRLVNQTVAKLSNVLNGSSADGQ